MSSINIDLIVAGFIFVFFYLYIYYYMLKKKRQMAIFIFFIPKTILGVISLILIEVGMYITEQGVFGYELNALYYYMLFMSTSMIVFYLFAHKINIDMFTRKDHTVVFNIFSAVMIILLVYVSIANPDSSRFNIFAVNPLLEKIGNILNYLYYASFLYVMLREDRLSKQLYYSILVSIVAVMSKVEFGTFLYVIQVFFIAYFFSKSNESLQVISKKFTFSKKKIFILIISLFAVGFLILNKVSHLGELIFLLNRLTLQAHMFWGSIMYIEEFGTFSIEANDFFANLFSLNPLTELKGKVGLSVLMNQIGDPKVVKSFIEDYIIFSGGYPSIFIFHFGIPIAFIINIVLTIGFVYFTKFKVYFIYKWNILIFIIFLKIFVPIDDLIQNGEYLLVNLKFFIQAIMFAMLLMILKSYKRKVKL